MASKKCYVWLRKLISLFENYGIAGWLSIKFLCVTLWHMSIYSRHIFTCISHFQAEHMWRNIWRRLIRILHSLLPRLDCPPLLFLPVSYFFSMPSAYPVRLPFVPAARWQGTRYSKARLFPRKVNSKPLFYFFKNGLYTNFTKYLT